MSILSRKVPWKELIRCGKAVDNRFVVEPAFNGRLFVNKAALVQNYFNKLQDHLKREIIVTL